jgi:drug/metabolite transporter (DMT)-like permease
MMNPSVFYSLFAATLFGASTPFAKMLVGELSPVLLAGLLYLGSGIGLFVVRLTRDRGWRPSGLARSGWPWLFGAILFGGVLGPVALMFGLMRTSAVTASLLLNLEAVLTAMLAWVVFKENADRRIVLGMTAIVAGGVVLSWPTGQTESSNWLGSLAVAVACLCWAIDNNLTRKVSASDALFIASSKGLIAGVVNTGLAFYLGASLPLATTVAMAMAVGLFGYGVSLVLFVLALRGLGAARSGAYFSTAPFIGAAVALVLLDESAPPAFWLAATLMGLGVWLHLTERHEHEHSHEALESGHKPINHSHPHYPDIHHRHDH